MVFERAMTTNEVVLGCMLESLVCNGEVSEALALFRDWRPNVGDNMVFCSCCRASQWPLAQEQL